MREIDRLNPDNGEHLTVFAVLHSHSPMKLDISQMQENDQSQLVETRWKSSESLWDIVEKTYLSNTAVYENKTDWLKYLPERRKRFRVQANRVFVDMESVINSLIANPPGINVLPARKNDESQDLARRQESFFRKKISDRNYKETLRMGLRNLYFGRLIVIKPFWNPALGPGGDFDFRSVDPRKIRVGKYARKEQDTEFAIEEIDDNLCAVVQRFPAKRAALMQKYGYQDTPEGNARMYIQNPDVTYKEAWIQDYVIFSLGTMVLGAIKNPYWDWDGIMVTEEEMTQLEGDDSAGVAPLYGDPRRQLLQTIKLDQENRRPPAPEPAPVQGEEQKPGMIQTAGDFLKSILPGNKPENATAPEAPAATPGTEEIPTGQVEPTGGATPGQPMTQAPDYKPYFFNYFDSPRKPYIFATIFNNENQPIGRTDMITLSAELQRGIDKRKMDIDENCELANGVLKIDSSVMDKANAQRIRFETKGIIWGKGVKDGVTRETGQSLPQMVFDDMIDSRSEIDNIMASSSAFRGEREGQETKAGRLALIDQSFLRLNELVQVVDYMSKESFEWAMQLGKTRYTEYHYAKYMGADEAQETIEMIQDDFETGSEVTVIAGKSLPVDREFQYEQAQGDFEKGALGLTDYLKIAQYDNPKELARNAVEYRINPVVAVGFTPEEIQAIAPQNKEEKPPSITINYADLPPDAQVQLLAQVGIQADPKIIVAEKIAEQNKGKKELEIKQGQTEAKVETTKTP